MVDVWLADLTYTQQSVSAESMPYGVASLAGVAASQNRSATFRLFKYPEALIEALEVQGPPQVMAFSHYVWNAELSLAFARAIKHESPKTVTILGGPHYSLVDEERAEFLRRHPWIDFYVVKEGEIPFNELVMGLLQAEGEPEGLHGHIPSVHSISPDGTVHLPPLRPRMRDMSEIPSPYTTGLLDQFFDGTLVPILQTNRGCPFSCTFCVEGEGYYQKVALNPVEQVRRDLEYMGRRMADVVRSGGRNELIISDSNFGMYPQDEEICSAISECQEEFGWPRYVNATTGKNKRDRVLKAIQQTNGAIQLTGSVQSLDESVLANIRRKNIATDVLMDLALEARSAGSGSYSEVILGLPGDSREKHLGSVRQLLDSEIDSLTMFQLSLLPGSELATPESRAEYAMESRFRVIPRCFGQYSLWDRVIVSAEVDEVCVGLSSLSFREYTACRLYDFYVAILHNQGPFSCVEKFLKENGLEVSSWMDVAAELEPTGELQRGVGLFLEETQEQLYGELSQVRRHVRTNIDQYVSGNFGNNEMYTYRAYVFMYAVDELVRQGFEALRVVLTHRSVPLRGKCGEFVNAMEKYVRGRLEGILSMESADRVGVELKYDIEKYETGDLKWDAAELEWEKERVVEFVLSGYQRELLERYQRTIGEDERGIGRALSKTRLPHFFRRPEVKGAAYEESRGGGRSA